MLETIKAKRRQMKPYADKLDLVIRSILLDLKATIGLQGSVEPSNIDELCDPLYGLPNSSIDYRNSRRNYDYWNNTAIWKLSSSSAAGLYSMAGEANRSFTLTTYVTIALVMHDVEQLHINVHVYPEARLSQQNRLRLSEIIQRQTGLRVLQCTHGDGCV